MNKMEDPEPFPPGGRPLAKNIFPNNWYDTLDRSDNVSLSAKGLRNAPGENNCFLNSAVQVFWHLDVFRRSYRRLTGHLCMGNSCIFCALKVIFTQFQYSDQASLPPDALRKALADTFMNQQRFQLGHMDDAAECFENILRRIHFHIANAYNEDSCSAAHCLSHQKFAMTVFDQLVCVCGSSSEPLKFHEMVHYVNTNALVSQYRSMQETGDLLHPDRFGLLLRNAGAAGDIRDCPGECGKRVQIRRTLVNSPDVVSIGLVWDSDRPNGELITDVARSIGTSILLQDVFHSVMCKDASKLPKLQLSALVCYYGKHYSTFVYHTKLHVWIYFDDATVKEIGPRWEHVVDKCSRGRYQPLLLLYTNPNASPICTDTAPKKRVMAPGYGTPSKGVSEKENRKSESTGPKSGTQSPAPSDGSLQKARRTLTPGADLHSPEAEGNKLPNSEHKRQTSFLIAITGKNSKKSEYAVPTVNSSIKQPLPGGQGSGRSDRGNNGEHRHMSQRSPVQQEVIGEDTVDGYNYTLSTSDPYRRPSLSSPDSNKMPMTLNFARAADVQRKESLKKGKDKVRADVIRYQVDPSRNSSDSDSPGPFDGMYPPQLPPRKYHHSQSYEESPANLSADHIDVRQHVVVKPKPNSSNVYENIDNLVHTPVQSGLATLPRNKKSQPHLAQQTSQQTMHSRQGSIHGEENRQFSHSRQSSTNTLTESHSRQSSTNTLTEHSRQNSIVSQPSDISSRSTSSVSQHSELIQHANHMYKQANTASKNNRQGNQSNHTTSKAASSEMQKKEKPPKPAKPEKKLGSQKKKVNQQQQEEPPALPEKKKPRSPPLNDLYINRKTVENVLKYQTKLSRQGSTNSTTSQASHSSNTSFDSDNFSMKGGKDGFASDTSYDTASLESQRDSGYGSSDRNSSSSTGSTTLDPYTQYFLSKSMIPPKTFNTQAVAENMKKFMDPNYQRQDQTYTVNSQYGSQYQSSAKSGAYSSKQGPNTQQQYQPMQLNNGKPFQPVVDGMGNPIDQSNERKQLYDPAIVRSHQGKDDHMNQLTQRLQVTENKQTSPVIPTDGQTDCPQQYSPELSPSAYNEASVNNHFVSLYQKSEDLMDQCVLMETDENFPVAINYCNSAIDFLKQALKLSNLSHQSYTYGQRKHNSCLLKLRSLQKKQMMRQESNSSTTSSDSARSSPLIVNSNPHSGSNHHASSHQSEPYQHQTIATLQQNAVHSRSSSRDSVDSVIENKNYRPDLTNNSSQKSSTSSATANCSSKTSQNNHERTNASNDRAYVNSSNNVDIYGTLPWKHSRKPVNKAYGVSNNQDPEVYRDFLNRQKCMVNSNDSQMTKSSPAPEFHAENKYQMQVSKQQQIRSNVAEIRPLNQNCDRRSSQQGKWEKNSDAQQAPAMIPYKEVCKTAVPTQQTANTHPVFASKSAKNMDPPSVVPPKMAGGGPIGAVSQSHHGKTSTYKAGKANASNCNSSSSTTRPSNLTRHASFTKPCTHSYKSVRDTGTLERHASQPDCQPLIYSPIHSKECSNSSSRDTDSTVTANRSDSTNQPELRGQYSEETTVSSRPTTPQPDDSQSANQEFRPSVRDLASKFGGLTQGHSQNRNVSGSDVPTVPNLAMRQRSKSESDFRNMQEVKPKSVLSKNRKHKGNKVRKSVTFCDNIALISAADKMQVSNSDTTYTGYVSDEEDKFCYSRSAYSDNEIEEGDSSDSPVEIYAGEDACNLCGKKGIVPGYTFCSKCQSYMSRFQQQ